MVLSTLKTTMPFSLGYISSEITPPSFEGLRSNSRNLIVLKPFAKGQNFLRKDNTRALNNGAGVNVISSEMLSGELQGSYSADNRKKEPSRKLEFVRTLLIDNYDSYTYNIYQELSVVNRLPPVVVRNDEWTWREIYHHVYEENAFDNIVISPGPGSPTCPADIGVCLKLLHECTDIPILGVCLGHQALGFVNGAEVVHASEPVHGRLSEIEHTGCALFNKIPSGKNSGFKGVRYHSLVIDPDSLPEELVTIAWTSSETAFSCLGNQRSGVNSDTYGIRLRKQLSDNSSKDFPLASCDSQVMQIRKVLMGIKHSSRPHYGLQVPEASCLFRDLSRQLANKLGENQESGLCSSEELSNCSSDAKFLKLQWRKLESLASQVGGARNIFCELFADRKGNNTFWLDSSSVEKRRARFSYMGGKGGSLWKQVTFTLSNRSDTTLRDGGYLSIEDASGSSNIMYLEDGFFDFLNKELQSFCYEDKDFEALPFDFYGGYIGYMGYDLKAECGAESNRHKSGTPDACLFFSDRFIVIDHDNNDVYLMSLTDRSASQTAWLDYVEQKLFSLKTSSATKLVSQNSRIGANLPFKAEFLAEKSRECYIKDVKKCQEFIKDGESYELCLTTQMRNRVGDIDSLGLYLKLREKNPAPYAAWLNFSNEDLCICCSSPERFLRLDRNGILEAKPIKGTIARGSTSEEDEMLKLKLQSSEKEQAENLMIVDLLRNDLGRVCEPGSVHVPHLMEVESYATVHTMVSTIRGQKRPNLSAVDCVRAAFPGGSMTGAPKLRSMELLDSLESCSRGIYSGCIGFFSYNQTFDLNIVIRAVVIHKGEASIGAGGAVVGLSNPEEEYDEMILKTRAPVNAVFEFQEGSSSDEKM